MSLPFAVYTRVSRIGDRKDTLMSHDDQRARAAAFADSHGLEVVYLPEESDVSGGRVTRPVLDEAIRGVEDGLYGGIIVATLDRLSRMSVVDALKVIERIQTAGGRVIAVGESYDSERGSKMVRNLYLSIAEDQLDRSKLQFRASKRSAVERGIWPFPVVPRGYTLTRRKDGGDGVLKRGAAGDVRTLLRACEARAAGASWREVGRMLGCSPSAARTTIQNRVYLGELRLEAGDETWVNASAHEALIPRDLWEAAQIAHPRPSRNGATTTALLAGIARCAGCSLVLSPDTARDRPYYRCRAHSRAEGSCPAPAMVTQPALDAYVEQLVLPYLETLEYSGAERGRAVSQALEALAATEAELDAYQQVTRVTDVGSDAFASGMRSRIQEVERARRGVAEARIAAGGDLPDSGTLGRRWPDLSIEQRRHVLRGALGAVFVRKGRGVGPERVKLLAAGFEPADLPRHHGTRRAVPRLFEWVDDLPGEVRPLGAQDSSEPGSRAAA
jgi:DNA invertase Pin-like site-specific DNA recombinase